MLPLAVFSPCRKYRYLLSRTWDESKGYVVFVGLNPSTADETMDDPTIRRCMGFAKAWGMGGIVMVNLFAYRATDPRDMKNAEDPVGPENDKWLKKMGKYTHTVVAAWGTHGTFQSRNITVREIFNYLEFWGYIHFTCLGLTKDGHPKHPLYLKSDLVPISY